MLVKGLAAHLFEELDFGKRGVDGVVGWRGCGRGLKSLASGKGVVSDDCRLDGDGLVGLDGDGFLSLCGRGDDGRWFIDCGHDRRGHGEERLGAGGGWDFRVELDGGRGPGLFNGFRRGRNCLGDLFNGFRHGRRCLGGG
ncbi:MAG: hypothetical protein IJP66_10290, partial [Kiritimatiellae bacterium]|nr:hypothetical protein [Kiritimatiellia bacterium]